MSIEPNVKEILITKVNLAINELKKSNFDGMKKLLQRIIAYSDLVSNKDWQAELKLAALIFGAVGGSTESDFEDMDDDEKKARIIDGYTDSLKSFGDALQENNISKMDRTIKSCAILFVNELLR